MHHLPKICDVGNKIKLGIELLKRASFPRINNELFCHIRSITLELQLKKRAFYDLGGRQGVAEKLYSRVVTEGAEIHLRLE